jgi:hypothetical protein
MDKYSILSAILIPIVTDHPWDETSEFSDTCMTAGEPSRTYVIDKTCILHNFHDLVMVIFLFKSKIRGESRVNSTTQIFRHVNGFPFQH